MKSKRNIPSERGTAPSLPTPDTGSRDRAGATLMAHELHGPQQPQQRLYGLARLRALLKLSNEVSLDELAESACKEIENPEKIMHEKRLRLPAENRVRV